MNIKLVLNFLGKLFLIEAALMLPALGVSLAYGRGDALAFIWAILTIVAVSLPLILLFQSKDQQMYAREGLAVAGLGWLLMSVLGGLPLVYSGSCSFIDAFFEITSGLTTTGATILTDIESLPNGILFWRSFTHWIGGMGVLVFTTAILPSIGGRGAHLARAESPGPTFSKLTPKLGDTAKILYLIYFALTLIETVALLLAGLSPYDAVIHAFGTAGTGGFSNRALSIGAYNNLSVEIIVAVFMFLFGVNFAVFFKLIVRDFKGAFKSQELKTYTAIALGSILILSLSLISHYGDFLTSLRYAMFQVPTIMSTTGYATTDFNLWPSFPKMMLLLLMLFGACAGSTAGGLKMTRLVMLLKMARREIRRAFQPRKVEVIKLDGKTIPEETLFQVSMLFFCHIFLICIGAIVVSIEGVSFTTAFTSSLTCISNVGPGLDLVGPMGSFAGYSAPTKIFLAILMLAGRLELYPILILFSPAAWRRG
ncbi:MAG: TrkH family potassium uptake protein [Clostridia bacterium]|nr:TrkH family potassium uptake protein [Clostridia bacterium]MBQ4620468.1 TrkH family potassium uptake protein [Clostridia bacterium]